MKKLGNTLLERRKEIGLTQQELANLAGVGINTLVAMERGYGNPSVSSLAKVADVLGLEVRLELKRLEL